MGQKRVSFEVAKAIKEAGYNEPCDMYYHIYDSVYDSQMSLEMTGNGCADFLNSNNHYRCAAPCALDVWLWLWREKKIETEIYNDGVGLTAQIRIQGRPQFFIKDPEEAIIAAIEYLAEKSLIK